MLTTERTPDTTATAPWRRPAALAAAAGAVVAIGVGAIVANSGSDSGTKPNPQSTLALKVPDSGGGPSMNSCIQFSVEILKGVPVAFRGTVTETTDSTVSLDVDRWYKGGSADVVTIGTPPGNTSIDSVEFVKGKRYLVTATDGTVNSCGLTGEATPDLQKAFDEAFTP